MKGGILRRGNFNRMCSVIWNTPMDPKSMSPRNTIKMIEMKR